MAASSVGSRPAGRFASRRLALPPPGRARERAGSGLPLGWVTPR